MIYTTLKANKEHGIDYLDIAIYTEDCWICVADLFEDGDNNKDHWGETDFDKLCSDYTERQIASQCLKWLTAFSKDKENPLIIWNKIFLDLEYEEIVYNELVSLIRNGTITKADQLKLIDRRARARDYIIRKEYTYGENNIYHGYKYISDLIDEYFPCYAEMNDSCCNNCGNCQ